MLTLADELGMNVTMLQSREWPYCTIELWWESLGRFRFTCDDNGEDVICAFPQASTSNHSAWSIDELALDIRGRRGMAPMPDLPMELGTWRLEANGTYILVTNKAQPNNHLFLTARGFYFFGSIGYALKADGLPSPCNQVFFDQSNRVESVFVTNRPDHNLACAFKIHT